VGKCMRKEYQRYLKIWKWCPNSPW
jgi:hypothetical protein